MPIQKVILLDCFVNKNDIILFISFLVEHHSSYDICCEHMSSVCVCVSLLTDAVGLTFA